MVRAGWTAGILVAAVALTGCAGRTLPPVSGERTDVSDAAAWEEPEDYRFSVASSCGERAFIGDYRVTVRDGKVASAEVSHPDSGQWNPVEPRWLLAILTLAEMLDEVREAEADGADTVEVVTDPADGHPVEVRVDYAVHAIDDESCYDVTEYEPNG
jgi:hypothetical protein